MGLPKLIGLAGPAGVGKDTVAQILSESGYMQYAFAWPLKQALNALGLPEPKNRADKEAILVGKGYSWRQAAQTLGTEWARALDENFWLTLAGETIDRRLEVKSVISDVRFENETEWVRKRGGIVWHLSGRETTVQGAAASHASETKLWVSPFDRQLVNDGSIEQLKASVKKTLGELHATTL